jgi:hypothetical protein
VSHAQKLINAIETCEPQRVRTVIAQLQRLAQEEVEHLAPGDQYWERRCYINDRLPGSLGLTALHVAAKAYASFHQDAALAAVFDTMVADLLDAGAVPWLEVGAQGVCRSSRGEPMVVAVPGKTVLEVCEGRVPPSLAKWFTMKCDAMGAPQACPVQRHASTVKHHKKSLTAWRARNPHLAKVSARG